MKNIPKTYEPHKVEDKWYQLWLDGNFFHAEEKSHQSSYAIVIPPPNVTGSLHIGHAIDNTLQDILIRWQRMQGDNTLWMPGTDHAGIITHYLMEQRLRSEGTSRQEIGREKFVERMWQWKEESRGNIISQLMKLGCSCDWERERFTLDEGLSKAVNEAFVRLYNKGLIYRGDYIVNWCPQCQTAVSGLEVEHEDEAGHFYYIKYPIKGEDKHLLIATTRPETMLGDTGVAVHPDDERYTEFVGKTAILPIVERELPIVADEYIDQEFGTGVLKVTPGHDPNDFEIGKRHVLKIVKAMNYDGTMSEATCKYQGLSVMECREALVEDLRKEGYLLKVEDYTHSVSRHERCHSLIEPFVSKQWFVKMRPLADRAVEAVKRGDVEFLPEREEKRFYNWMAEIQDWCISRQIWWGHRFPVWYCLDCDEINVATKAPEKCHKCGSGNLQQEEDVLDTWFSSALWPFSTLGWPEETGLLKTFYPTSALVTGWDILFFWVSRMIMMGLECMDEAPFRQVYLHPLVTDEEGQKMSKSRGNVIDPLDNMEKYGTDAFRFAIAACMIPSTHMQLPENRIGGYRNFANKIWNASRFVLMNLEDFEKDPDRPLKELLCDKWIRSRFNMVAQDVTGCLEEFQFADAAQAVYNFLWHEYCDWYIELIKPRLYYSDDEYAKYTARYIAAEILEGTLRLLHPFMPFITEEIWQNLPHEDRSGRTSVSSIVVADWPEYRSEQVDVEAVEAMEFVMEVIDGIRSIRGEMNVPPSSEIEVLVQAPDVANRAILNEHLEDYLKALTKVSAVSIAESHEKPDAAAVAVVGEIEAYIPLKSIIDIDKEKARLKKKIGKAENNLTTVERILSNEGFLQKAPEEVVQQKRERKVELETEKAKLEANLRMLG